MKYYQLRGGKKYNEAFLLTKIRFKKKAFPKTDLVCVF